MNRRLVGIAMVAVAVLASDSAAQTKWQLGLRGGVNVTQLRGDPVGPWVSGSNFQLAGQVGGQKAAFNGGGFVRRMLGEQTAVQLEALFSRKGGKGAVFGSAQIEFPGDVFRPGDINGEMTISVDYVEFPLLAMWVFPPDDNIGLTLGTGPVFGFRTKADARLQGVGTVRMPDGSTRNVTFDELEDISRLVKQYEFGWVFAFGLEFALERAKLLLDGRWNVGLTTIDNVGSTDVRNYVATFSAGVGFPLGAED